MSRIDDFRAHLTQGGARPTQFEVNLVFPAFANANNAGSHAKFMCAATSLPASTIQPIEVPYRGRMIKLAGERTFQNWNIRVLNDGNFIIRGALERWSKSILEHSSTTGIVRPSEYAVDLEVKQLGRPAFAGAAESVLRHYVFHNCWPVNIAEISLDFGNVNAIEDFTVEFSVDYWTTKNSEIQ